MLKWIVGVFLLGLAEEDAPNQLARGINKELIEINTTYSNGDTTKAAQMVGARLKAAGSPEADMKVIGSQRSKANLIAR